MHVLTCDSFSCFFIVLNLKRPSLSLSEGLFLMEQGALAGAGQGTGFRGDVEGNLGGKEWFKLYNFTCGSPVKKLFNKYFTVFWLYVCLFFYTKTPVYAAYLYSMLLSSRTSVPQRPFTSSITWFLRNFFRSCTVCCLVTSGPKLLLLQSSWWSQSTAAEAVKQEV